MRKLTIFTAAVLALTAIFSGCNNEQYGKLGKNGISLTVKTSSTQVALRGPEPGEDIYNENLLNSIYYFFYPEGETTTAPVVKGAVTGISKTGSHTEQIPISANELNNVLFKNGNRNCELFVVANPPAEIISLLKGEPTLATLRAATFLSSLDGIQDDFVMVFDDTITVDSRFEETAVEIEADLSRLACKFTINADVASVITADGISDTWTPAHTEGAMTVTFRNALNRTTLSGFDKSVTEDEDYFDATPVGLKYDSTTDGIDHFKADLPIYSYPMAWEFTDKFEPMIMFDVKYNHNDGNGNIEEEHRYYKLMLGQKSITSNDWYVMTTQLSVIGSLLPDDPVVEVINIDYIVNDWKDAFTISVGPNTIADIKSARYLMVPQTTWTVNNENEIRIPFSSSHKCDLVDVTVTKKVFYDAGYTVGGEAFPNRPHDVEVDTTAAGFHFSIEGDELVMRHNLNNTLGATMDFSPYRITLTIKHEDNSSFSQQIDITQYPALWIDNQLNSSGETDTDTYKGYVYVNGNNARDNSNRWRTVLGAASGQTGSNTSRYLTTIHVSQFAANSGYVIGDPRVSEVDNLSLSSWSPANVSAKAYYEGTENRQLRYYYPTDDAADHRDFIAPVLRVSSAHSHMSSACSYQNAKRRCASYQEDGYPAGRWRLPTYAEVRLMAMLSDNNMIPSIYLSTSDGDYFFAGGYFSAGNYYDDTSNNHSSRCVYDEWYWSKIDEDAGIKHGAELGDDRGTFVWGDMPRNYDKSKLTL